MPESIEIKSESDKLQSVSESELSIAKAIFDKYDTDCSSTISSSELFHLMNDLGEPVSKSDAEKFLAVLDKDGNGVLSLSEFIDWFFHSEIVEEPAATHLASLKKKMLEAGANLSQEHSKENVTATENWLHPAQQVY